MQPKFTNTTTMSEQTTKEMMAVTWGKNAGFLRILLFAVAGFAVVYAGMQLYTMGAAGLGYAGGMLLLGAAAGFVGGWGYLLKSKSSYKQQKALWGADTLEKQVDFYEDKITQHSKLGELTFAYTDITAMLQGKTIVVLMVGQAALLLQVNGFKKADYQEFLAFIKTKINKN
ncbi:YcxB family protein [Ruminococcaceae bacterium OttesenSCG-928-A16]|nr:YcxB family protein [Ruminococcaceae bacterium OttesenSCG-928-A16]